MTILLRLGQCAAPFDPVVVSTKNMCPFPSFKLPTPVLVRSTWIPSTLKHFAPVEIMSQHCRGPGCNEVSVVTACLAEEGYRTAALWWAERVKGGWGGEWWSWCHSLQGGNLALHASESEWWHCLWAECVRTADRPFTCLSHSAVWGVGFGHKAAEGRWIKLLGLKEPDVSLTVWRVLLVSNFLIASGEIWDLIVCEPGFWVFFCFPDEAPERRPPCWIKKKDAPLFTHQIIDHSYLSEKRTYLLVRC